MELLSKLKLWQVLLVFSFISFAGGFTGFSLITNNAVLEDKENIAIGLGAIFFLTSLFLKYFPPKD